MSMSLVQHDDVTEHERLLIRIEHSYHVAVFKFEDLTRRDVLLVNHENDVVRSVDVRIPMGDKQLCGS